MQDPMTVRCPECGYENKDLYRYCGMCGATLRAPTSAEKVPEKVPEKIPVAAPRAVEPAPRPVTAAPMSVLGLSDAPAPSSRSVDYLLEDDEPRRGHWRAYLTLCLLVLTAALVFWHWRRDGYPWAATSQSAEHAAATQDSPTPAQQSQPAPATAPASTTPAPDQTEKQATTTDKDQATAKPAAPEVKTPETNPEPEAQSPEPKAPTGEPEAPPAPKPVTKPEPKAQSPEPKAQAATAAESYSDKLASEGEKYLYGNGVPQNCNAAQKNLRAAAGRQNAKAYTLLGAMYATGHCVNRDLPTAYRWFAKALHKDPSNGRVEQDLSVLWKQMTADERQAATRSE